MPRPKIVDVYIRNPQNRCIYKRYKDIQKMISLYKIGHRPTYSKTNNWITLHGTTFNGFSKEDFEKYVENSDENPFLY